MRSASRPPSSTLTVRMRSWRLCETRNTGSTYNETPFFVTVVEWWSSNSQDHTTSISPTAARARSARTGSKNERSYLHQATQAWSISSNPATPFQALVSPEKTVCLRSLSASLTAKEIIVSLMNSEEKEISNDPELLLAGIALLLDFLAAHHHAALSSITIQPGVHPRANPGANRLTGRVQERIALILLVAIDHRPMTPSDRIAWRRRPTARHTAKIPVITAAHTQQRSGGHAQKITGLATTASHRPRCYHPHPNPALANVTSAETAVVSMTVNMTAIAHENEAGTEDAVTEVERNGEVGLLPMSNLAPSLVSGHRLRRPLPLPTATPSRTCQISSMSSWVWNAPTRRSRRRLRL